MKRMLAVFAILALGTGAVWANGVGVLSSYWTPADADGGFGWGGKLQVDFGKYVGLELRGTYFADMSEDLGPVNLDLEVIPIEADLIGKIPLGSVVRLYAGGGGGYYMLDVKLDHGDSLDVDDELGWFAVAGIELAPVENLALFAEFKYTGIKGTVKNDDIDNIVSGTDLDLSGPGANVGVMLTW
jgi:hypothetical protein